MTNSQRAFIYLFARFVCKIRSMFTCSQCYLHFSLSLHTVISLLINTRFFWGRKLFNFSMRRIFHYREFTFYCRKQYNNIINLIKNLVASVRWIIQEIILHFRWGVDLGLTWLCGFILLNQKGIYIIYFCQEFSAAIPTLSNCNLSKIIILFLFVVNRYNKLLNIIYYIN